MIIQLEGIIKFKTEKFVVLDVNGVGYRVFISFETLRKVSKKKDKILFWTHLAVRENALDLYGFLDYAELEFFEQLIQISGIGPKSALAVLAVAPLDVLRKAISTGETSYLTKVSGVGRKLAEKIVLELKDKLGVLGSEYKDGGLKEEEEALEALRALGYSLRESRDALRNLPEDVKGTEGKIREALKNIHK
ncbi:Holliday junction branch migration protein RuvA [Patescibacteria group bacterium]